MSANLTCKYGRAVCRETAKTNRQASVLVRECGEKTAPLLIGKGLSWACVLSSSARSKKSCLCLTRSKITGAILIELTTQSLWSHSGYWSTISSVMEKSWIWDFYGENLPNQSSLQCGLSFLLALVKQGNLKTCGIEPKEKKVSGKDKIQPGTWSDLLGEAMLH